MSRPRFQTIAISGFDQGRFSSTPASPVKYAKCKREELRRAAPSRNLYESLNVLSLRLLRFSHVSPSDTIAFGSSPLPFPLACSFRDATCLETLIEPRESNVCVRETNLANTKRERLRSRENFGLIYVVLILFSLSHISFFIFYFLAHEILFEKTRKEEFC